MFKGKFGRKSQKSYEDIQYTCTIRFLDDSEPITVTFQVRLFTANLMASTTLLTAGLTCPVLLSFNNIFLLDVFHSKINQE